MVFLCVKIFFHKPFGAGHVDDCHELHQRGITCFTSQDAAAQRKGRPRINEKRDKTESFL